MSKVLVDRELLERVEQWVQEDCTALEELQAVLAQPAEADGAEVVCYQWLDGAHYRRKIPAHCIESHWRPLMTVANHQRILSVVTAERDRLREENKRLDLMVSEADFNYDQDRDRMAGLLRNAMICLEQWNLKHPRLAKRGEEHSSEHTYRQIRAFLPEYREFDAAMAAKEA